MRGGEHVLGLRLLLDALRLLRGGARGGDGLERLALVGGVALDRLDEVRDQVVALAELDVDLGPRVLGAVPQPDELVEHRDDDEQQHDDDRDDDDCDPHLAPNPTSSRPPGEPDRVLAARVRAAVEPAVARLDLEARSPRAAPATRRRRSRRASSSSRARRSADAQREAALALRPSRRAPRSRARARSSGRSSRRCRRGAGVKTSKARRPPGRRRRCAARERARGGRRRSPCAGTRGTGRRRAARAPRRAGRAGRRARRSSELGDACLLGPRPADLEHPGRGVDADHRDAGLRDRDGDPAGADAELDDRAAAARPRLPRLGDVEARRPRRRSGSTGRRCRAIGS